MKSFEDKYLTDVDEYQWVESANKMIDRAKKQIKRISKSEELVGKLFTDKGMVKKSSGGSSTSSSNGDSKNSGSSSSNGKTVVQVEITVEGEIDPGGNTYYGGEFDWPEDWD